MNSWSSFHDFLCWFHLRPASLSMVHALADKVCPHSIHLMTKNLPETDLKKSKILGWFHLIFWSNSSTLDNAWHRILGHVLAFGGQMCSSLFFLWNSEETNFENKKSRMSYSWALDQARLLPWPFLKFNFIEHGCSSKRLTLLVIELYRSIDLPRKYLINIPNIQMWNGIKLTKMFKILLSCFSWWCQAWSPAPSLLARHWEKARCIFTI